MDSNPDLLKALKARLAAMKQDYDRAVAEPAALESDPLISAVQRAAAVRGWFSPTKLLDEVGGALESVVGGRKPLHDLRAMCVVDSANPDRWILQDRFRQASILRLAEEGALVEETGKAAGDPHARLAHRMLTDDFDPGQASTEALATAGDVERWLSAVPGRETRAPADYSAALELNLRNDELDRLSRGIVGREVELGHLLEFIHKAWRSGDWRLPLLRLEGIGGVGKSTLLAEFVRRRMSRFPDAIVVWIDYDRLRIRTDELTTVLVELSRQLGWAVPPAADALHEARRKLRDKKTTDAGGPSPGTSLAFAESADSDIATGSEEQVDVRAATDLIADELRPFWELVSERPVLVILDTVEQLERADKGQGDVLLALHMLRDRALRRLAVIASGRSVFTRGLDPEAMDAQPECLGGLSREYSRQLLVERERMPAERADRLMEAFADLSDDEFRQRVGIPMLLTLLARLEREGRLDLSRQDTDYIRSAASAEMAAGYIYHRVLEQLPEELRRVAHPGLVLRQMSEQVLREVVWPVIEARKPPLDDEAAGKLFKRLTNEAWLVDRIPGSHPEVVQHRSELRRAMLLLMYEDANPAVRRQLTELNIRARDWYRDRLEAGGGDDALLEAVYHALALAVLTGKVSGLRISEIRAVRERLREIVPDFPEEHRPAVSALVLGGADAATIASLPANLRVPVLGERLRSFVSRRHYRDGLAFLAALPEEDRGRTPSLAWLAIRCFLQSGQWATQADTIAPLVADPQAPGLRFGKARPSLLPYMTALMIPWMGASAARRLTVAPRPKGIGEWVERRYDLVARLFNQISEPQDDEVMGLEKDLLEMLRSQRRRSIGVSDTRRLAAILTSLQLRQYGSHVYRWTEGPKGLTQVGLAGLHSIVTAKDSVSSARLVAICRSIDAEIVRTGGTKQPITFHWVAMFDDFHTPLGLALCNAVTTPSQAASLAYSIADTLWPVWPIRPHDFRPSTFADACKKDSVRPERYKTLAALADRAELMPQLLKAAAALAPQDPDLKAVVDGITRWRAALAPISPNPS